MDIFVYGTLQSAALMQAVAGGALPSSYPAKLRDYQVRPVRDNVVPFIKQAKAATATGLVWTDISAAQLDRLDAYEGAFGFTLQRLDVIADGQVRIVNCYLPPSDIEDGNGEWSLAIWESNHLAPAILAASELFSRVPVPDHAGIRRLWPMIERRAWAKHRANLEARAPATIRYEPGNQDVDVVAKQAPHGSFFALQSLDLKHRNFHGSQSGLLHREIFLGSDAAMVLPYDPVQDRVLLVEQARVGPLMRNDPNPWTLEPVAGMVDARETPREAAIRETHEEAGLTLRHLEEISRFYSSPGSTTDYFYAYLGLCELSMSESYIGGLAAEGEDLRLHPMSFDKAMALTNSGEITAGPLILMMYWLALHRERLRAMS